MMRKTALFLTCCSISVLSPWRAAAEEPPSRFALNRHYAFSAAGRPPAVPSPRRLAAYRFSGPVEVAAASPPASEAEAAPHGYPGTPAQRPGIGAEVFGRRRGYIHPVLSVGGVYTDNVFNSRTAPESDFTTIVSPAVWVALPGSRKKLLDINTSTVTPGGLMLSRDRQAFERRYQAYLLLGADLERYREHEGLNADTWRAEGFFQYNFPGGLSIDLIGQSLATAEGVYTREITGQFITPRDERDIAITAGVDRFTSHLANASVSYEATDRFRLRCDLSGYLLDFEDAGSSARDRRDLALAAYLYLRVLPKTSLFGEYETLDINYDTDLLGDSREHNVYLGVDWRLTAKSGGRLKAGYGLKDFRSPARRDVADYLVELRLDHDFSSRNSLKIIGVRKINETTVSRLSRTVTSRLSGLLTHKFNNRLEANLNLSYANDRYEGTITVLGETGELEDSYYTVAPFVRYEFRRWLQAYVTYIHTERDSSFDLFDYAGNTALVRLTVSR